MRKNTGVCVLQHAPVFYAAGKQNTASRASQYCPERRSLLCFLFFVRTSPDILFLSVFYKLVSEIRVRYGYDHLGALPGAPADEVHCAVFSHEVIELTSR